MSRLIKKLKIKNMSLIIKNIINKENKSNIIIIYLIANFKIQRLA